MGNLIKNSIFQEEVSRSQYDFLQKSSYDCAFLHGSIFALPNDGGVSPAMKNGTYEYCNVNQMKNILHPGDIVVDIGACIGLYSVVASQLVGSLGRVIAIEPESKNIELLKWNLLANSSENVDVLPMAVSDVRGNAYLELGDDNIGDNRLRLPTQSDTEHPDIQVVAIDDIINKDYPINFMKIDVQGNEVRVLRGCKKTIQRQKRFYLCVEFCPEAIEHNGDSIEEFADLIFDEFNLKSFVFDYKEKIIIKDKQMANVRKGYNLLPINKHFISEMSKNSDNDYCDLWCCLD